MVMFTQLSERDIVAIAGDFGLGEVVTWTEIPAGTINSNFSLETTDGRFVLRINEGKSEDEVRYEAELVTELVGRGVPAPLPHRAPSGDPFVVHDGRYVSLFPWVEGSHRSAGQVTASDAAALGRALARLHRAGLDIAEKFQRAGRYTFEQIVGRFEHICTLTDATSDPVLAPALAVVKDEIAWLRARDHTRQSATRGIIHGDLFPDNVMFAGPELTALIDFEQASAGSLAYDVAVCLNSWCYDDEFDPALITATLSGYQEVRAMPRHDLAALPVEVRAAAMRFIVTRITDVYLPGVDNPDKDFRSYLVRLKSWRAMDTDVLHPII
ncbi:MAG: homoserine kinase [Proteobacteria bacterium]|nr:homoserine kinase [Pseudomonadota bacterium]